MTTTTIIIILLALVLGGIILVGIVGLVAYFLRNNQPQNGAPGAANGNALQQYGLGNRTGLGVLPVGQADKWVAEFVTRDDQGNLGGYMRQEGGATPAQAPNGAPAGNNGGNPAPNPPAGNAGNGGPAAAN